MGTIIKSFHFACDNKFSKHLILFIFFYFIKNYILSQVQDRQTTKGLGTLVIAHIWGLLALTRVSTYGFLVWGIIYKLPTGISCDMKDRNSEILTYLPGWKMSTLTIGCEAINMLTRRLLQEFIFDVIFRYNLYNNHKKN